ncbi:MAG: type III-B CRISPR module-associated Cmr3 family protein [Verrucomicrobiota bacterium JB025]|nr:type III-B CRISPR module-associated Cmr3 family protein [Verrucomicrobiota bacterium JB025]
MNQLLLNPTDVLFFKDGRPMSGSLSGHGAAWPLPTVTNAALHAALHRAEIGGVHNHRRGRSGNYSDTRDRKFGSLKTAGPFPVCTHGGATTWFFPRPLDAGIPGSPKPSLLPLTMGFDRSLSSLPQPFHFPVANTQPATKDQPKPWLSKGAWNRYLGTDPSNTESGDASYKSDSDFADTESTFGIGIDPDTGTQDGEGFYSAHYLRLREGWSLGCLAEAEDKEFRGEKDNRDLVQAIFPNSGTETPVIIGGQQRVCTVRRDNPVKLPLPLGETQKFEQRDSTGKPTWLVKWVLLTPAIFPTIDAGISKRGTERNAHPGGYLPTWVCPGTGNVLLETVSKEERKRRRSLNAGGKGYASNPNISAKLVAAITGKPIPVTGYALDNGLSDRKPGPKPTLLAVPAGSVYYFECDSPEAARKLATALNWHGDTPGTAIENRRSTLMGEKGFGLGVCSTWSFHDGKRPG